MSVCMKVKERK